MLKTWACRFLPAALLRELLLLSPAAGNVGEVHTPVSWDPNEVSGERALDVASTVLTECERGIF